MAYNLKIDGVIQENVRTISALTEDGSFGLFKAVNDIKTSGAGAFKWGFTQRSSSEEYVIEISDLGFIPSGFLILLAPEIGWDSGAAAENNKNYGSSTGLISSLIYFVGEDQSDPTTTIHQRILPTTDNGSVKIRVNPNSFTPIINGDGFKIKKATDPYNPIADVRYFWIAWA